MKNLLLFFLFLCGFSCNNDSSNDIRQIFDPNVLYYSNISENTAHLAFPSLAANEDNSKIIAVYRKAETHLSYDGVLIQKESVDNGVTWSKPKEIYTPSFGSDARDPQLLFLGNDSILCRFFERYDDNNATLRFMLSEDMGNTYHLLNDLPMPDKSVHFLAARGNMINFENNIYSTCYDKSSNSWLIKSTDKGQTWETVNSFTQSLAKSTNSETLNPINESSLSYNDNGDLILVGRSDNEKKKMQLGVSSDLGKTWQWEKLPYIGQAPSLTKYGNNFILTYRSVDNDRYQFNVALLTNKLEVTYSKPLFYSETFDMGYGDVILFPTYFMVCCYIPEYSIRYFKISYDLFN